MPGKKRNKSNQKGTTLVELIVTFALMGIFMTAATLMLSSTLQMFTRIQSTSRAILVSDNILDKVTGEIAAADLLHNDSSNGYYFWLGPMDTEYKSSWVVFKNRSGSPIAIFAASSNETADADMDTMGSGQLYVKYYAVEGNAVQHATNMVDWHFDSNVYMGYTIDSLKFSRPEESHPNVLKIEMRIRNTRTGFVYDTFRYTECYNYEADTAVEVIGLSPSGNIPVAATEFKYRQ